MEIWKKKSNFADKITALLLFTLLWIYERSNWNDCPWAYRLLRNYLYGQQYAVHVIIRHEHIFCPWLIVAVIYATFSYSCFPKWRIIHVFPTCLAPKITRGLRSFLFFQTINSLYICLFIMLYLVISDVKLHFFDDISKENQHFFDVTIC